MSKQNGDDSIRNIAEEAAGNLVADLIKIMVTLILAWWGIKTWQQPLPILSSKSQVTTPTVRTTSVPRSTQYAGSAPSQPTFASQTPIDLGISSGCLKAQYWQINGEPSFLNCLDLRAKQCYFLSDDNVLLLNLSDIRHAHLQWPLRCWLWRKTEDLRQHKVILRISIIGEQYSPLSNVEGWIGMLYIGFTERNSLGSLVIPENKLTFNLIAGETGEIYIQPANKNKFILPWRGDIDIDLYNGEVIGRAGEQIFAHSMGPEVRRAQYMGVGYSFEHLFDGNVELKLTILSEGMK